MAIQNLCFKKSFLIYGPFLPQASSNNWNKKWHKFYYNTHFLFVISARSMAEPQWGLGVKPWNILVFFSSGGQINILKQKKLCKLISFECKINANML